MTLLQQKSKSMNTQYKVLEVGADSSDCLVEVRQWGGWRRDSGWNPRMENPSEFHSPLSDDQAGPEYALGPIWPLEFESEL